MNQRAIGVTGLVSLALAIGCTGGSSRPANVLVYGRGGETDSLDPIHVDTGESVKVLVNIFDTLIGYADDSTKLVPALATSWSQSDDGRKWTFQLRQQVKFHDGTPFDADAVVFTFERLMQGTNHPHVHSDVIPYSQAFTEIKRVYAADPQTVVFELAEPSAVFEANLAMFPASIVSPTAVKSEGAEFAIRPVGTGPFRFVSWTREQELTLAAFDGHWHGRPKVDRVVFIPVKESAVRIQQLLRGEIHIADDLPPAELETLTGSPEIVFQEQSGINLAYLSLQTEKPPLDSPQVRQAIWHAIDKRALIEVAYSGQARPAVNPLPPTLWSWHDGIQDRAFDLDKARQLMDAARSESGFSLPVALDLFVMASPRPYLQQPQEAAVFIKEALKPIGIDVRIVTSDINQHFQRLSRGEHQLALAGWSSDNCDPDNFLYQLLDPDNINTLGGNNTSRYRNMEVHRLLLEGKRELDREKREQLYRRAQELIFADAPIVPLAHTNVRIAERAELKGYRLHPTAIPWLRLAYFEGPPR